jgi:MFS family permease
MSKPVLGLILGAILGVFDGLTALLEPDISNNPEVGSVMSGIIAGSAVKGLFAGLIIGFFARKVKSLKSGLIFGGAVGLVLAFIIAAMPQEGGQHYWLQIMIPGTIVGIILGYATQKYGKEPKPATAN